VNTKLFGHAQHGNERSWTPRWQKDGRLENWNLFDMGHIRKLNPGEAWSAGNGWRAKSLLRKAALQRQENASGADGEVNRRYKTGEPASESGRYKN